MEQSIDPFWDITKKELNSKITDYMERNGLDKLKKGEVVKSLFDGELTQEEIGILDPLPERTLKTILVTIMKEIAEKKCIYCGREGGSNPSDYGLHYTDGEVFQRAFTCSFCDKLITQTNRRLKLVLEARERGHKDYAKKQIAFIVEDLREIADIL